jgi:hypothetical protein
VASANTLKWASGLAGLGVLLLVYRQFNPYEVDFLPRCSFHAFTGFTCPGCGSQRSLHFLLHLDLVRAFGENPLLVLSLPYLLIYGLFRLRGWDQRRPALRKALFGPAAIKVILVVIVSFWLGRNAWDAKGGDLPGPISPAEAPAAPASATTPLPAQDHRMLFGQ